jgi:DNA-directed RNA polymerase subunit RPC12/RpoP
VTECGACGREIDHDVDLRPQMLALIMLYLEEERETKHLVCPDCAVEFGTLALRLRDARELFNSAMDEANE